MAPSLLLVELPEELLLSIFRLLIDANEHKYRKYPDCLYNYASQDIHSLSLVNHQLRRICLPLLLSYVKCRSITALNKLKSDCLANSAIACAIRTLDIQVVGAAYVRACQILTDLIPYLQALVWLDLRSASSSINNPAFFAAVNCHPTLQTVVVPILGTVLQTFGSLSRFVARAQVLKSPSIPPWLLACMERGLRVATLAIHDTGSTSLETITLPGLHELHFMDGRFMMDEKLSGFLSRHPELDRIAFEEPAPRPNNTAGPYLARFLEALERQGLMSVAIINRFDIIPSGSGSVDDWNVAEISLSLESSAPPVLALVGEMFPRLACLMLRHARALPTTPAARASVFFLVVLSDIADPYLKQGGFMTMIMKNFRNVQKLQFENIYAYILSAAPVFNKELFISVAVRNNVGWLVSRLAQALPLLTVLHISEQRDDWWFSAEYDIRKKLSYSNHILTQEIEITGDSSFYVRGNTDASRLREVVLIDSTLKQ
ncbi:hypothetical protein C8J56DRAFT_909159 [Mycena floridula]|nr:hypothetical protein C8J56DRAFT_909159 [Mycena floridula]